MSPSTESSQPDAALSPRLSALHSPGADGPFYVALAAVGGVYVVILGGMLLADVIYMASSTAVNAAELQSFSAWLRPIVRPAWPIIAALSKPDIQYSVKLTMISCLFTAILSLLVAVPLGYSLSRFRFRGRDLLDAALDIPIVLPPLVIGLSLLILFQYWPFRLTSPWVVFKIPAVILAQFMVAAAFAIRTMRATFDQIDRRPERVARTLGANEAQVFTAVVFPQARQGMLTAGTLAWSRALGEFGPLLIFAGATRRKTEVLSTTVFLEISIGDLESAVAVSLIMVAAAVFVLMVTRIWGVKNLPI